MVSFIFYIPWITWVIGYPIYKKIRGEDVWKSNIFVPIVWILCIIGNVLNVLNVIISF